MLTYREYQRKQNMAITKQFLANFLRALRLPFATASIFPFIAGSLLALPYFKITNFLLGLICAVSCHLSANLINDYADSKSQADWQDIRFYGFFGGSKLIQEKVFTGKFYLNCALVFLGVCAVSITILSFILKSLEGASFFIAIMFLAWSYSQRPLQFSYRRWGELIIFLLFGPALVMGGYFLQTGIFPTPEGFLVSVPFGVLTATILFANEVPDYQTDAVVRKFNWISIVGVSRAFIFYYLLIALGLCVILLNITLGYLNIFSLAALMFLPLAIKAGSILKLHYNDKARLVEASKLTIKLHTTISIVLIISIWLRY